MKARALALVYLIVVLLSLWAEPAAAHAVLEATTPPSDAVVDAAPQQVSLTFSEPVDVGLGGVQVIAPDGSRVEDGASEVDRGGRGVTVGVDGDERGTYTVVWSVVSEDNHTISGSFLYSVGVETGAADVESDGRAVERMLGGVGRALGFAGTALFVGALAFGLLVVGRDRAGRGARLGFVSAVAGGAVLLGAVLALLSQVAVSSGRSFFEAVGLLDDAVAETRFGALGAARTGFAVLAVIAGIWQRRTDRAWTMLHPLVALGLVVVPALAGHAWSTSPRWLAVAIDAVHLTSTSVWVGGLVLMLVAGLATGDDAGVVASRFSRLAVISVAVVVVTGLVSSYLQVRNIDALTGTGYGLLLIAKVAAVVALIALGWANRRRVGAGASVTDIRRLVAVEVAIAVFVLGLTATLVNRPPARSDLQRPFADVVEFVGADGSVRAEVQPAQVGTNVVHLYFLDERGLPSPVDAVELSVGRAGIPPRRVKVTPVTADHASAYGVSLPSPGRWTFEVTVAREGAPATAKFEVGVR